MSHAPRVPILLALVCALFLRALVPAGWMPAEGQGPFAIELCPGAAALPMAGMDSAQRALPGTHGSHHKDQHGDCAFSPMQAGFAPADELAPIVAPILNAIAPASPPAATIFATGPPSLPPPATGPPALA